MAILIDIPQVAYKTWNLEYVIVGSDGKRDRMAEYQAEMSLREHLSAVAYSTEHEHVR